MEWKCCTGRYHLVIAKKYRLVFDTSTDNIGLHIKNIYAEGELDEVSTTEDFSVVQLEGSR
jgi:hypothetical protein